MPNPFDPIRGLVSDNLEKLAEQARPLVLIAGLLALLTIGFAVTVDDQVARLIGVCFTLALISAITWLLYRMSLAATTDGEDRDLSAVGRSLAAVNGEWWQLVVNETTPGVSLIEVELSVLPGRQSLSGTKYAPDGSKMASWQSRAVGLIRTDPSVHAFYYWEGQYPGGGVVSGIGVFRFERSSADAKAEAATGWFTTGDVEEREFDIESGVILQRADPKELELIRACAGPERKGLIARRYEEMAGEFEPKAASE